MNKIKRGGALALAIFALIAAIMPINTKAGPVPATGQPVTVFTTLGNATTTNMATPVFIDASQQQYVAFSFTTTWSAAGESTGSTNILYTLAPTVDGVKMDTNKTVTLAAYEYTSAGVPSTSVTNLSANGLAGWFVIKAVNNSSGTATNSASAGFQYAIKIGQP